MEKYIERMCDESKELSAQIEVIVERGTKLDKFISENPIFLKMDAEAQQLQRDQLTAMRNVCDAIDTYRNIVDKRIAHELNK